MKDRYFYALSDCLARRKEWVRDVEIFFRFRELREKAEKETFKNNLIIYLIYKIINLPTNFLNSLPSFFSIISMSIEQLFFVILLSSFKALSIDATQ